MKVRGRRRCRACDARWSYYETGSVACPDCGSLRSVGVDDERTLHTDGPAELDLGPARSMLRDRPNEAVARAAGSAAREYLVARGFVRGGELLELDGTVLAAAEVRYVADHVRRTMALEDASEAYFYDLLAGAEDGDRPAEVPGPLQSARGLAAAEAVESYRHDVSAWLDEHPDPDARRTVARLRSHEKRLAALDGEVPQAEADALVEAARAVGHYLRGDDESGLERAASLLDGLD